MTRPIPHSSTGLTQAQTLYIFPHAGGDVSFYVPFARAFAKGAAELKRIAVQYPGQAGGGDVSPITSIPALADDIYSLLKQGVEPDRGVALFGHSMGAGVAFELAQRFEADGTPVTALFVSASSAPGRTNLELFGQTDQDLVATLAKLTGASPEFLDEGFLATIMPTLRGYRAILDYDSPAEAKVSCPIYAYAGSADPFVEYDTVLAWADRTTGEFAARVFPGDHFYLAANTREVAEDIETRICRSADQN